MVPEKAIGGISTDEEDTAAMPRGIEAIVF